MYLEFPIAYPIAKLLDRLLGEEQGVTYKKAELKTFVGLHRREFRRSFFHQAREALLTPFALPEFGEETLNDDEVTIISSVLEYVLTIWGSSRETHPLLACRLGDKSVSDIMTPLEGASSFAISSPPARR
jgi:metal transporter CNNM